MKIDRMKPGMVVYSVGRQKMGNTTLSTVAVWSVYVRAVDMDRRRVEASWNGNTACWFSEREASKWREKKPVLVKSDMWGRRLATREEIKAMAAGKPQKVAA